MMDILKEQYGLVKSSRAAVFEFIDAHVGKNLNTGVKAFDDRTIRYLLVHTANTYVHWLHNFAFKKQAGFADDLEFSNFGRSPRINIAWVFLAATCFWAIVVGLVVLATYSVQLRTLEHPV